MSSQRASGGPRSPLRHARGSDGIVKSAVVLEGGETAHTRGTSVSWSVLAVIHPVVSWHSLPSMEWGLSRNSAESSDARQGHVQGSPTETQT